MTRYLVGGMLATDVAFHNHIAMTVGVRVAQPKKTFADAIDISPNDLMISWKGSSETPSN